MKRLRVVLLACLLASGPVVSGCAAHAQPPAGTYSEATLRTFNAVQLTKDLQALSDTVIALNKETGKLHVSDRDTAYIRDFVLSAGAGLVAYGQGKGQLGIVVAALETLTKQLSAETAIGNDRIRFYLNLIAENIHRIPTE